MLASGALAAACGSSTDSGLFGHGGGAGRSIGGTEGSAGANGSSGANGANGKGGANGSSGASGNGGVSGNGTGGIGAAGGIDGSAAGSAGVGGGTGGTIGSSGATGGNTGSAGVFGTGGVAGSQGVGGVDAGTSGSGGSGTGGSGGSGGFGGSGGSGATPGRPPCVTKPSQTVLIGDSYVNWTTHTFRSDLAQETGETWRLYAMGGAAMATGGIGTLIPDQFENAVRADRDIRVVVMDGGGNDILLPAARWSGGSNCKNRMDAASIPVCQQIVQASLDREQELMERMAQVGVRDLVFFFYPTVPNGTLLGGAYPNAIATWARPKAKAGCDDAFARTGGRLRCHFVDMVPVFQGHPEYFARGDIHPNSAGSAAMASAIWSTMKSACVAQKAGSGCCEP